MLYKLIKRTHFLLTVFINVKPPSFTLKMAESNRRQKWQKKIVHPVIFVFLFCRESHG